MILISTLLDILSAYLLLCAMEKMITRSSKRYARPLMIFSCYLLTASVIYIGDPINILLTILFFLFTIWISFEGSFLKKLTIGMMFASAIFAFNALRDNYLVSSTQRFLFRKSSMLTCSISSLIFTAFLYLVIKKFSPEKHYELSESMWKLLLLLTATPISIVLCIIVLYDWNRHRRTLDAYPQYEYAILLLIALFSFIGLLLTVSVLAGQQAQNRRIMFADINRSYYEAMEQQHFEIRRLKHDMANHLQILSALPDDKRDDYIRQLSENAVFTQTLHYCGDTTVNAVLSVKEIFMGRHHIRMTYHIDIPEELPFDKTDICALFANTLDNAAEACCKLEEAERQIILESKAQKGLFCLKVQNPAPGKDDIVIYHSAESASFPVTSKQDKEHHGFGLKSIAEIASRYQGALEIQIKDEVFEVFLYMAMT